MSSAFPGIKASGASVQSIVAAIKSFSVLIDDLMRDLQIQTRDANGAPVLAPNAWYDLDAYLPIFKKIDTLLGGRGLEKAGSLMPQNAVFPPHVKSIQAALQAPPSR
ncbi:hypothetical protein [Myxococcus sp. AB056]|uniref:hypothetical protein n=1 Tax=Myxococcus sp. AB056 TaxID=2562792 RepID=UPI00129C412F|nr:hypothetical protein [Myxococcus sp. AB056]